MFDLSMQSTLDIFCYVLVLIYGLALSADLSTGGYVSRQQKYLLTLLCLLFLLMQGLGLVLLGERAVKQLYPLVTHVPLVLILILFMKKSVGVAIVSTCTAYLCCQPPRWGRIAVEALTQSTLAAAAEGLKADIGVQVRLPGLQKRRELFQFLDLIITYCDIHGAASLCFSCASAALFYHKKMELSPQNLHFTGVCTHFAAYTSPNSSTSGTMSFAGTTVPCGRGRLRMKWVIWLVAIASTSALVALWFWEVRRLLRQHRSMVESARCQLAAFEKRAAEAAGNADVAEVLRRSESIYRQAAGNYNETLHRPWIYIPGRLMGFHYEEAAKVPGRVHI